jgi:hypothetical protein
MDLITKETENPADYTSVFAELDNKNRDVNPDLFKRFARMLVENQDVDDNEELINLSFVRPVNEKIDSNLMVWQAVWYENKGKSVFGAFYQSKYPTSGIEFIGYVRPLAIVQKQVNMVDITYHLPNGLPFHSEYKFDFVDHGYPYL